MPSLFLIEFMNLSIKSEFGTLISQLIVSKEMARKGHPQLFRAEIMNGRLK